MDGAQQLSIRKNWSSLMLFNCGHPANAALTPALATVKAVRFCTVCNGLKITDRGPSGDLELAGGLVPETGRGHAESDPLYSRRPLV